MVEGQVAHSEAAHQHFYHSIKSLALVGVLSWGLSELYGWLNITNRAFAIASGCCIGWMVYRWYRVSQPKELGGPDGK